MTNNILAYSKAIIPIGVALVLFLVAKLGLTPDMTLKDVVTLVLTSGLVWAVPNKQV